MDQGSLVCKEAESLRSFETLTTPMHGQVHGHGCPNCQSTHPSGQRFGKRSALLFSIGGTVLSAFGFIAMMLFEQYNSSLAELRNDLKHFNEISSDFVKKESFRRSTDQVKECVKENQIAGLQRARLEQELWRDGDVGASSSTAARAGTGRVRP